MPDHVSRQPPPDGELPEALAGEIASLYRSDISVPPTLDDAILSDAKVGLARRLRFRRVLRWATAGAGAAAAAAVVWAASMVGMGGGGDDTKRTHADAATVKEDIDHNGRVDIIDAFVVAKQVDAGPAAAAWVAPSAQPGWDVTGDGRVDRRDVDRIAAVAVAVSDSRPVGGGTLQ